MDIGDDIILSLCIKMDIEGSAVQTPKGSKEIIKWYHPNLAVCTYHRMKDIKVIPQTIKEIREDYRFTI